MKIAFERIPAEFVSDTSFYDYRDPMSDALTKVNKFGAVVVFKDGEYYGIVDDRSIARKGATKLPGSYPVGKFAKPVPIVTKQSNIKKAIRAFYESASKAVPFADNGKIKGILKRSDILKSILSMHMLSNYNAGEVMSTPLIAIDQEATLDRAKRAMADHGVNRLAVMDKGKLVGILTYKNIIESLMSIRSRSPEFSPKGRIPASVIEFAHKDVYAVEQGEGIDNVLRNLIKNNVSSMLVTRKGKPVGVVTIHDILETIVKNSNIPARNIIVSGLTEGTKEYEDDLMADLGSFAEKVEKFRDVKVDYIAVNIKSIKGTASRSYELRARVGFARGGTISMSTTGFNLERTLRELTSKLYRAVEAKNDLIITGRKI